MLFQVARSFYSAAPSLRHGLRTPAELLPRLFTQANEAAAGAFRAESRTRTKSPIGTKAAATEEVYLRGGNIGGYGRPPNRMLTK